jgi:hypothetical protein
MTTIIIQVTIEPTISYKSYNKCSIEMFIKLALTLFFKTTTS